MFVYLVRSDQNGPNIAPDLYAIHQDFGEAQERALELLRSRDLLRQGLDPAGSSSWVQNGHRAFMWRLFFNGKSTNYYIDRWSVD